MTLKQVRIRSYSLCLAATLALAVIFPLLASGAGGATITYRRIFKGSNPEFIEITIAEDGTGTYDIRQLSESPDPEPFQVNDAVRSNVFRLAGELHDFQGVDLDVHRRIADLGQKTFRYEKGGEVHEVQYNYTLNKSATQLALIFEGLFQQERDRMDLQQKLRYDRLGVNDSLKQFQADLGQGTIPEPDRLLPVLDQIGADTRIVDVARQLARSLAERIRIATSNNGTPVPATTHP